MAVVVRQLLRLCPEEFRDKRDKHGWHPLHILSSGCDRTQPDIRPMLIRSLCQAGCEIDPKKRRDMTPLMVAVSTACMEAADELINNGADVNLCNAQGTSVLDQAWHNGVADDWLQAHGCTYGRGVTGAGRQLVLGPMFLKEVVGDLFLYPSAISQSENYVKLRYDR